MSQHNSKQSDNQTSNQPPLVGFDIEAVRSVALLLKNHSLSEITIETTSQGEGVQPCRLHLKRGGEAVALPPEIAVASPSDSVETQVPSEAASTPELKITSPAVGVFRAASEPVRIGDEIAVGQIVGTVESLRIPNDVVSTVAGKVLEIVAIEGRGVEFGEMLLTIDAN